MIDCDESDIILEVCGRLDKSNILHGVYPIYQPLRSDRIWHKVNLLAEFNRF